MFKPLIAIAFGCAAAVATTFAPGMLSRADAAPVVVQSGMNYAAGTIVIVNNERKLYYMLGGGKAIRYPVAVGRASQVWTGQSRITAKRVNPDWLNPDDPLAEVVPGGPGNPLGERALNIGNTLYRIHGTPARGSIGRAVSNGCIRMFNSDVKHLFRRVSIGTKVVAVNSKNSVVRGGPKPVNTALYLRDKARVKRLAERKLRRAKRQQLAAVQF